jgi:hypothetical protein
VGPKTGLDRRVKFHPHRDSIPGPSSQQSVVISTEIPGPQSIKRYLTNLKGNVKMFRHFGTVTNIKIILPKK